LYWQLTLILDLITEKLSMRTFILPGRSSYRAPGTMYLLYPVWYRPCR